MPRSSLALLLIALAPLTAAAQGSLANQGFGYPFGQLSTRALATGGAVAEFDPRSPWNPAAVAVAGRILYLQLDPEYRRVTGPDGSDGQRFIRFPIIAATLPVTTRFALGLSASSLLDRTGQTTSRDTVLVEGDEVVFDEIVRSDGAINDLRVAAAYSLTDALRIGVGAHAITGQFQQFLGRTFETPGFDSLAQSSQASFGGLAFSGGVQWQIARGIAAAGSARYGRGIKAYVNDTARTSADVPHRVGIGLGVERISGVAFAAHAAWEGWSSFDGLGSENVHTHDSREVGFGAEIEGPSVVGATLPLRLGVRWRELPFSPDGNQVTETAIGGGLGIPLLGGFSMIDIGVMHARRSTDLPFRERSLIFSLGLTVRP